MNRTAKAMGSMVLWAWLGGCGGGTLGGNGGMIGTITGAAGVTGPGRGVDGGGGGGFSGFGGDIAPPPGGRGGPGGTFGMGGRPGMCPSVSPPVCGLSCGNGRIDSCTGPAVSGCPIELLIEECDGADLGPSGSCASWGYTGGKISCNGDCTVNLSGCSFCVSSPSVLSCGPSEIPLEEQVVGDMSLAANDTEVAVATVTYRSTGGSAVVALARLSSDLVLQHNVVLDDNEQPGSLYQAGIFGTAVAPIPSGWVVAVCGDPEIYIHAVDATTGWDVGRTVVSPVTVPSKLCLNGKPVLAARPDGGPLMLWQTDDGVTMSMIGADGLSASPPQTIVGAPLAIGSEAIGAAWVGGEFAVVVPIEATGGNGARALRVLRVLPDGTPRFVGDFWTGEVSGSVRVVTGASEVRVVYGGLTFGYPNVVWWRRAMDGSAPPRVSIGSYPAYAGDAPAVSFGDDTLVLMRNNTYGFALSITRVAADGQIINPPSNFVTAPYDVFMGREMVRRGPEAVVGWHSFDQISLARLRP
jgi:hypothetical protein